MLAVSALLRLDIAQSVGDWELTLPPAVSPLAADDSALSIAGFYHCALDRRSGTIDGLYFDPVALPYQTLTLAPKRSSQVCYSHEAFAFR